MCGRYVIISAPDDLRAFLGFGERPNFPPRYNIAPTQPVPIVRLNGGKREFALVRWGLIPSWVKDPRKFSLLINARAESVLDKPAFRAAMRRRRCIFPADGFYEWKQEGSRTQPYFIQRKGGGPFAIAGIWETWTGPNGEEVETAALITTDANSLLRPLHDRMPAVLTPETFDMWLDAARVDADIAAALLRPAPEAMFEIHPVSTAVNRTANDAPELIAPVIVAAAAEAERIPSTIKPAPRRKTARDDGQASLF